MPLKAGASMPLVLRLLIILVQLAADAVRWSGLMLRSPRSIEAENLFLRRQLALYKERGVKPRRIDSVTRITLAFLSRFFHWREAKQFRHRSRNRDSQINHGLP
jgi:putative transposase